MRDGNAPITDWRAFLNALGPVKSVAERLGIDDALVRQEAVQQMAMTIAQAYMMLFSQDPRRPHLVSVTNPVINSGTNPDYMYFYSALDGKGTYRLSGARGTSLFVHVVQNTGMIGLDDVPGPPLATLELDELKIAADRTFSVLMSAERPNGYTGDWWKLDPRATSITIRQASYDWEGEHDGRFALESLDKHPPGPRRSSEAIGKGLDTIARFVDRYLIVMTALVRTLQDKPVNTLHMMTWGQFSGLSNQHYYQGRYALEPDEALVIETDIPKQVRYWGLATLDPIFNTIDWVNNQSSLNGFQARPDADGKFRAVLSLSDPGVANWLDPAGHPRGMLQGRWFEADSGPTPTAKLVKLKDLRRHLPESTPSVTPEERDAALRARRRGAQFRRKW